MKKILAMAIVVASSGCMMDAVGDSPEQVSEGAQAVGVHTVIANFALREGKVTIKTNELPMWWYYTGFDESPISVFWNTVETPCKEAASGTFDSETSGSFSTIVNTEDEPIGYSWSMPHDVEGLANHWHNEIECNSNVTVVGCPNSRPVTYLLSVGGACEGSGSRCTTRGWVTLPPVQDPDVVITDCPSTAQGKPFSQ